MQKLPQSEFEVMKALWALPGPVTAGEVLAQLPPQKEWKVQTVITLLSRLRERGFVTSEKKGKERWFQAAIPREEYLQFETGQFLRQYHDNSFVSFVSALYDGKEMDDADADELLRWLEEKKQ